MTSAARADVPNISLARQSAARLTNVVDDANQLRRAFADMADAIDCDGSYPSAEIGMLRECGLLAAPLPAALGGADLGIGVVGAAALFDVLRAVGCGNLAVGRIYEGHVNALLLVRRYGTAKQVETLARQVLTGAVSGVWNAESASIKTVLRDENGERVLHGGKILASGAGHLTLPLVPTTNNGGVPTMVLVHAYRDEHADQRTDASAWVAHGMRATSTGTVDLSGIRVDSQDIIGQPGDYLRQPFFSGGAWRFCAVQLGAVEALVAEFRTTLLQRGRDGDAIQAMRLAECTLAVETARLWVERAARITAGDHDAELTIAYVDLTRGAVERAALEVLDRVQRGIGLQAFMRANAVERIARDLRTYLRQPAPDAAMLNAAAAVVRSAADPFAGLP